MIPMQLECKTCCFWHCLEDEEGHEIGECRKQLPTMGNMETGGRWPLTLDTEWCGTHSQFPQGYDQWRKDNAEQLCGDR